MMRFCVACFFLSFSAAALAQCCARELPAVIYREMGYINHIPEESTAERTLRHERIAARRAQEHLLLVHRGASAFARENTIEAYAAALDRGADGVEIDIRRSKDGVLYLFHDDTLERLTSGQGKVRDVTYYELLRLTPEDSRPPTLAAAIVLFRERAALLHLDIKEGDIQEDIIRMFDEADIWDHVVHVNPYHSDKILSSKSLELHDYKGWVDEYMGWLRSKNADLNEPGIYDSFLEKPGRMLFTAKDPADGVRMLGREGDPQAKPLPVNIRAWWTPGGIERR